jgi:hypothetical protein
VRKFGLSGLRAVDNGFAHGILPQSADLCLKLLSIRTFPCIPAHRMCACALMRVDGRGHKKSLLASHSLHETIGIVRSEDSCPGVAMLRQWS